MDDASVSSPAMWAHRMTATPSSTIVYVARAPGAVCNRLFPRRVKAGLLQVLSDIVLPDGRRGLFHPDNLSFSQTSSEPDLCRGPPIAGVGSVQAISSSARASTTGFLADGFMKLSRAESRASQ